MNRNEARELAETTSEEDLKQMFLNAQSKISDWTEVSRVNRGMTKGTAFNILSKATGKPTHILGKTNMIWEFGEYLPNYQKKEKAKRLEVKPVHQEPKFFEDIFD